MEKKECKYNKEMYHHLSKQGTPLVSNFGCGFKECVKEKCFIYRILKKDGVIK